MKFFYKSRHCYEVTYKYKFKHLFSPWKTQTTSNLKQVYVVWSWIQYLDRHGCLKKKIIYFSSFLVDSISFITFNLIKKGQYLKDFLFLLNSTAKKNKIKTSEC